MPETLYILTDLDEYAWLEYLLGEFIRINRPDFNIQIRQLHGSECHGETQAITYSKKPGCGFLIPNRSDQLPDGHVEWLSDKLYICRGTTALDWPGECDYDLFWNAFVFLSRLEEYTCELGGHSIGSYCMKHPRVDKRTFEVPVVNYLFDELAAMIKAWFPALRFRGRIQPVIEFSHDVDYIKKTPQLRIKQTVMNMANVIRSAGKARGGLRDVMDFLISSPSYWCFNEWVALEKTYGIKSVFYVYAGAGKKNLKQWLLDPSYVLTSPLVRQLKTLHSNGFCIGLHGSYESAVNEETLVAEKARLEQAIGFKVTKIRQHWLRYRESITPDLHSRNFDSDSTLGWNDKMGFRSGVASQYCPYNHRVGRGYEHMEIPQIIMDSTIFDYNATDIESALEAAEGILKTAMAVVAPHVSISWHQRTASADYNWHITYENLIKNCHCEYL